MSAPLVREPEAQRTVVEDRYGREWRKIGVRWEPLWMPTQRAAHSVFWPQIESPRLVDAETRLPVPPTWPGSPTTRRDGVVATVRRWLAEAEGMDPAYQDTVADSMDEVEARSAAETLRECAAEVMRLLPDVFDVASSASSQTFIDTGAYLLVDGTAIDEAAP